MDERPWLRNYDSGVPKHIEFPKETLTHLLEETARKYPNQPCAIFKGQVVTYAEMNALSDRLAAGLAAMGVDLGRKRLNAHAEIEHHKTGQTRQS